MKMDEGIDTGDIISQQEIPISQEDTGGSLFEKLAKLGGKSSHQRLFQNTLPVILYLIPKVSPPHLMPQC